MRYLILEAATAPELCEAVNIALKEGAALHGGVSVAMSESVETGEGSQGTYSTHNFNSCFAQAVIFPD